MKIGHPRNPCIILTDTRVYNAPGRPTKTLPIATPKSTNPRFFARVIPSKPTNQLTN